MKCMRLTEIDEFIQCDKNICREYGNIEQNVEMEYLQNTSELIHHATSIISGIEAEMIRYHSVLVK